MHFSQITFHKDHNKDFYKTLQTRVKQHFKDNNRSKFGDYRMVLKTIFMLSLYLVPFVIMLFFTESKLLAFVCWLIMGVGMAGIGLSVMHDANHGAYSKHKIVNQIVSNVLVLMGGSDENWRIQHNVLHHTYTNVTGVDEDLNPGKILRFSPHEARLKHHKFQHFYAWFLYGLMTLLWCTVKDYRQARRYQKMDLTKTQNISYTQHVIKIILGKIFYYAVFLTLPLLYSPLPWWLTIIGFLCMHFIFGVFLAMIFQPAHVVPTSVYPIPSESGNISADWAVNQLLNTSNFAQKSKSFSWFVGGLNFQVEHHLFPSICHIHYADLSVIVKETAKEFNLPYHSEKTFFNALHSHTLMLKNLGRYDLAPAIH